MIQQLTVTVSGETVTVFASPLPFTIGRDASRDLVIDHPSISGNHGELAFENGTWNYRDHSSYGSFVNGQPVTSIRISGPTRIRLFDPHAGTEMTLVPVDGTPVISRSQSNLPGSLVESRPAPSKLRIGRSAQNDLIIADDLTVSSFHAELRQTNSGHEIVDLGTSSGTFVNGRRIDRDRVDVGDLVGIGRHVFVLRHGSLEHYLDDRAILTAVGLRIVVDGGKLLLDDVTFSAEPGQLVAVVGPSGAGKSTLLRSLVGVLPATDGTVRYNGRDVYRSIDELRSRIGYVPQDDILHADLTPRQALRFAAELRYSDESTGEEREERVDAVMGELGLTERADLPIAQLSGGQRKRASVALELLTEPALLFLDEPTSGLDPGLERSVMELLRNLADGGRTVLVITHAVTSLDLCDRVLVLAPGGSVAYYGPPADVLAMFGVGDYPEVFRQLETGLVDPSSRWINSDEYRRYVSERLPTGLAPEADDRGVTAPRTARQARQLATLARRQVAVLRANRNSTWLLMIQAPLLAALIIVSLGRLDLANASDDHPRSLLMVVILAANAMGLVNSTREIVRELPIYRREKLVGLSMSAYLGSKIVVLGAISAVQSIVLCVMVFSVQRGPATSVLLPSLVEMIVVVFMSMLAAVCLGLAVSALVKSDAAALVLVPVLLIAQLVLSNALIDVERSPLLRFAAFLSPAYWSYAAVASSMNLKDLDIACAAFEPRVPCSALWTPGLGWMSLSLAALAIQIVGFSCIALVGLRRQDAL